MSDERTTIQVTAPTFCASLVACGGRVVEAAPILRRDMMGKTGAELVEICKRKGWTWARVETPIAEHPAVAAVLRAFPGAAVVSVRRI